jgi:hypothetical protein
MPVLLLVAPFEHHDFSCELKTPLHCTACASTSVGADPHTPDPLGHCRACSMPAPPPCQRSCSPKRDLRRSLHGRSPPLAS